MTLLVLALLPLISPVQRPSKRPYKSAESRNNLRACEFSSLNALPVPRQLQVYVGVVLCSTSTHFGHLGGQTKFTHIALLCDVIEDPAPFSFHGLCAIFSVAHFCATSSRIRHLSEVCRLLLLLVVRSLTQGPFLGSSWGHLGPS